MINQSLQAECAHVQQRFKNLEEKQDKVFEQMTASIHTSFS